MLILSKIFILLRPQGSQAKNVEAGLALWVSDLAAGERL